MSSNETIIKTLLAEGIKFSTVSGVLTTRPYLIEWVDRNIPEIVLITTKSYQVLPNEGNREPVIVEPESGCYGNAVGLRNPGMDAGYRELVELIKRHKLRALLNISVSANSIDDFIRLVNKFESIAGILELNFSCPHAKTGYGSAIGSDHSLVAEYMKEIRKASDTLLFPKLTPNVENIGDIARAAVDSGADGITAINTVGPEVFKEPVTGIPVLYNPAGHRGGKSGEWIKEIAVEKIRDIRRAVGEVIPIIGMGGVSTAEDVLRIIDAGANVVGLGSILSRIPGQDQILQYISSLKSECLGGTAKAGNYISTNRLMEYRSHKIIRIKKITDNLKIFYLDGSIECQSSQYVFLFLPGTGEKPFSIAESSPPAFVIRLRGEFTQAIFNLKVGDRIFVRGVYGADSPMSNMNRAYIVAGGTGIAVAPKLIQKLEQQGKEVTVYYGTASEKEAVLEKIIKRSCFTILDEGKKGRVLDVLQKHVKKEDSGEACFYNIGPIEFMKKAVEIEEGLGANSADIYLCLETQSMCGIGMCGSCECGGRLLCKEGTFVSLDFLQSRSLDIPSGYSRRQR